MRQMLADKVSGDLAGLWLLVAEHLRLGTWDLLRSWTGQTTDRVDPRLALQLVHEAAICTAGIRADRTLHSRCGFELLNGLPFVAADATIHDLLDSHTMVDSQRLQVGLGKLRLASGHFQGKLLAIDPHRVPSFTQRRIRTRVESGSPKPLKMAQTFWALDADTHQPVCFTTATAARGVTTATPELLNLASEILHPNVEKTLVVADGEHFSTGLLHDIEQRTGFDLLVPLPNSKEFRRQFEAIPPEQFTPRWAGFATTKMTYQSVNDVHKKIYSQFVERAGERPEEWYFKGFLCTSDRDEVESLTSDFPKRWHVEEFFNANQALGWQRAGTMNLNIRYGQMTMALVAQAVIHQLRTRLGEPYSTWDAKHLARDLFFALEGDVRVKQNTITVTYYNAPHVDRLRQHYQGLPDKLRANQIAPEIPWLYNYTLDFRFR